MGARALEPNGLALLDYFNGDAVTPLIIHRDDGHQDDIRLSSYFRDPSDFSPMDRTALGLCRGRVLDAGAGAGPHSLALQDRGLSVCAIDICPQAVEIMQRRGGKDARCADVREFGGETFDTILMLGATIAMVGTLSGLDHFLDHIHRILEPDGQVLLNSIDVRCTDNPAHLAYHEANRLAGRYVGEIRCQYEYRGRKGPMFCLLFADSETLTKHARKNGWSCDTLHQEERGHYLVRLFGEEQRAEGR